jgi:alpha-L-fucosidase
LEVEGNIDVEENLSIDPFYSTTLPVSLAKAKNSEIKEKRWMEKFGEWKHIIHVEDWREDSQVSWKVDVYEPGYYKVDLNYAGNGRMVWRIETDEGEIVQNQQNSSHIYNFFDMGVLNFKEAGQHIVTVSFIDGENKSASLKEIRFTPWLSMD